MPPTAPFAENYYLLNLIIKFQNIDSFCRVVQKSLQALRDHHCLATPFYRVIYLSTSTFLNGFRLIHLRVGIRQERVNEVKQIRKIAITPKWFY